jgi:hypothetical protein
MDKQYGKYKYKVSDQITHHVPKEEYESKIDYTVEPLGMTGANIYGPAIGATQLGSNVLDQKVLVENCGVGIETWRQNLE